MRRILLVSDEPEVIASLKTDLGEQGYTIQETGLEAFGRDQEGDAELVLLDLDSRPAGGASVIRNVRSHTRAPLIVLSPHAWVDKAADILDAGADDCVVKPFGVKELLARMNALLRGSLDVRPQVFSSGELALDFGLRRAFVRGKEMRLTSSECSILSVLAGHHGEAVSHERLLQELWSDGGSIKPGRLRVLIARLRMKIEHDPSRPEFLFTEPGIGYRLG
jgi:two-component system KDP operon response regulator KdpE